MEHQIIAVPYDSGHRNARMGRGPLRLADAARGSTPLAREPVVIESAAAFATEIGTAFELHRAVATAVASAVRAGRRPIVLSGNCNGSLGTIAGLQEVPPSTPLGVVWFDGHGDCSTPETFNGDFLDSMGLSTLTGRCWQTLTTTVPGFAPLPDASVVLIGGHGADEGSLRVLSNSAIEVIPPAALRDATGRSDALEGALARLRHQGIARVYLHLDLDVLDARLCKANEYAPEGGLSRDELLSAIGTVCRGTQVAALGIASYDPGFDQDGRIAATALTVMEVVAYQPVPAFR